MLSLNSNQVDLNHKYREVLYTYMCLLLDLLVNQILLSLMFGCPWRMSGECDWQLVPWNCRGGKSCGTFHRSKIWNYYFVVGFQGCVYCRYLILCVVIWWYWKKMCSLVSAYHAGILMCLYWHISLTIILFFGMFQKKGRLDDEKIETMLTDLATIKKFE
jgi:hypothetical protein